MRRAFSLIEIVVVMALIVVITAAGFLLVGNRRNTTDLDSAVAQITATLAQARQNSISSASSTAWGVRFYNATSTRPNFQLFASSTYATGAVMLTMPLPTRATYDTSSLLAGGTRDVVFGLATGQVAATSSIALQTVDGTVGYRISISRVGLVSVATSTPGH